MNASFYLRPLRKCVAGWIFSDPQPERWSCAKARLHWRQSGLVPKFPQGLEGFASHPENADHIEALGH